MADLEKEKKERMVTEEINVVTRPVRGKDVTTSDLLKAIAVYNKAKKDVQAQTDSAVIRARAEGYSWVQIASALGISPQGARQKYLSKVTR